MEIGTARIGTEQDLPSIVVACQIGLTRIGCRGQARNGAGKWVDVRCLVEVTPIPVVELVARTSRKISAAGRLVMLATLLIVGGLRVVPMAYALVLLNIRANKVAEMICTVLDRIDMPVFRAVDTAGARC